MYSIFDILHLHQVVTSLTRTRILSQNKLNNIKQLVVILISMFDCLISDIYIHIYIYIYVYIYKYIIYIYLLIYNIYIYNENKNNETKQRELK